MSKNRRYTHNSEKAASRYVVAQKGRGEDDCGCKKHDNEDREGRGNDREPAAGDARPDRGHEDDDARRKRLIDEWRRLGQKTWTPWLLLRYRLNDLGFRPIPAGEAHWHSPDIYVESSDPNGNAVAGEDNFVHARVFNLGLASAIPTRVDFYWADPSIGLGPSSMNHIGTEWVDVSSHKVVDVRCSTPWVPVFVNNGHECLKVNCSNVILDPIEHPFEPRLDRHVGQRNITVLEGETGTTLTFSLKVGNLFARSLEALITARVQHLTISPEAMKRFGFRDIVNHAVEAGAGPFNTGQELMARYVPGTDAHNRVVRASRWLARHRGTGGVIPDVVRSVAGPGRNLGCVGAEWDTHRCLVPHADDDSVRRVLDTGKALAQRHHNDDLVVATTTLAGYEQRRLSLTLGIPTSAQPNDLIVYRLTQRVSGIVLGGYTVVAKVSG